MVSDSDYREILLKSGGFLLFRILGLGIAYYYSYYIIKQYNESVYGLVALALTVFSILVVIGKFGFDIHLTKMFSAWGIRFKTRRVYLQSALFSLLASGLLCSILYTLSPWLAERVFNKAHLNPYLQWTFLSIPIWSLVLVNAGVLRGLKMNGTFSLLNFFTRFALALLFLILALQWGLKEGFYILKAHFYAVLSVAIISTVLVLARVPKERFLGGVLNIQWQYFKDSWPIARSTYYFVLLLWTDKLVLGVYETEANIGMYDIALKIALMISFIYEALNSIMAPKIAHSYQKKDWPTLEKNLKFSVRLTFFAALGAFLVVILIHKYVLAILSPEYLSASILIWILGMGKLISSLFGPVSDVLQMTGHQLLYSRITFGLLLVNIVLNILLVQQFGVLGAAIATTVTWVLMFVVCYIVIKRRLGFNTLIFAKNVISSNS